MDTSNTIIEPPAIDLQRFCGNDDRYLMSSPFVLDGWKYGTSHVVTIRVACEEPNTIGTDKELPPASKNFGVVKGPWEPWPQNPYCRACFDTGIIGCSCATCDCGEDRIRGCGKRPCLICNGIKRGLLHDESFPYRCAAVGNHWINIAYDSLISALPSVQFLNDNINQDAPLPFVFDGGEGRVMGCKH